LGVRSARFIERASLTDAFFSWKRIQNHPQYNPNFTFTLARLDVKMGEDRSLNK